MQCGDDRCTTHRSTALAAYERFGAVNHCFNRFVSGKIRWMWKLRTTAQIDITDIIANIAMLLEALSDRRFRDAPQERPGERARRCMPIVEPIARRLHRLLPRSVEIEDLIQFGFVGLLEADRRYRGPGESFQRYARSRIRAAMLGAIPAAEAAPRLLKRSTRHLEKRSQTLEQTLGRRPKAHELAAANGLSLEAYQQVVSERHVRLTAPADAALHRVRESLEQHAGDPFQVVLGRSQDQCLRQALLGLGVRKQSMLSMHYGADIKLKVIAVLFGITESRVSQILSHAVAELRAALTSC